MIIIATHILKAHHQVNTTQNIKLNNHSPNPTNKKYINHMKQDTIITAIPSYIFVIIIY